MNKIFIILLSILLLSVLVNGRRNRRKNKKSENTEEEDDIDKEININSDKYSAEDGLYMSDSRFEEKLKKILKERKLKSKTKISKEILKQIFNEVYKKEFTVPDLPVDEDSKMDPEEEAKKFMDEIFEKVCRGLDYDQKIRVSEIKNWISPKRAQEGLNEVMQRLEEMMGYL